MSEGVLDNIRRWVFDREIKSKEELNAIPPEELFSRIEDIVSQVGFHTNDNFSMTNEFQDIMSNMTIEKEDGFAPVLFVVSPKGSTSIEMTDQVANTLMAWAAKALQSNKEDVELRKVEE